MPDLRLRLTIWRISPRPRSSRFPTRLMKKNPVSGWEINGVNDRPTLHSSKDNSALSPFPSAEKEPQGSPRETESFPQPIGEVAFVREVDSIGAVGEDDERGRLRRDLGRIIEFHPPPLVDRRLMLGRRRLKDLVQLTRRDP